MCDNISASATGVKDRDIPHRDEIAVSRHDVYEYIANINQTLYESFV